MAMRKAISTYLTLPNSTCGAKIPAQGFGTWDVKNETAEACYNAILHTIKSGVRLIDCAPIYGNQNIIGQALKKAFNDKLVKREDLFIVSKVWNTDHAFNDVIESTKRTIKDLQCDYLDLLLIHWPSSSKQAKPTGDKALEDIILFPSYGPKAQKREKADLPIPFVSLVETWQAMEELVKAKLVKDIGVSNFRIDQIELILKYCKIAKPVVNQINCHPGIPQNEMRDFCKKNGLLIQAYGPLGIGGNPKLWLIKNPTLSKIAKKAYPELSASHSDADLIAKLLLQWSSQIGNICLCKTFSRTHIEANALIDFGGLSPEVMDDLKKFGEENAEAFKPANYY